MRCFGRQCRGQAKIFVQLVRHTATRLLEGGSAIAQLAQDAQQMLDQATHLRTATQERLASDLSQAIQAPHRISKQSQRLTQGKRRSHCHIVNAYDPTIAPILTGKSNGPAQFGRKPGMVSQPTAGFICAARSPMGNPSDARDVLPLLDNVENVSERLRGPKRPALLALAGALGVNDPALCQALHARGIPTVGIPETLWPVNPTPSPEAILAMRHAAGLHRKRTPHQVQLACACGFSRPVGESHIACLLSRGAGQMRYKGPQGAVVQLGMTVMAHKAPLWYESVSSACRNGRKSSADCLDSGPIMSIKSMLQKISDDYLECRHRLNLHDLQPTPQGDARKRASC
jgi:hypothetical protein